MHKGPAPHLRGTAGDPLLSPLLRFRSYYPRRVRPLHLHASRAAPASRLATAAFHLHLTALRACCGCTALLALMCRARMRVPAEACEGAAGTHDPAASVASSASAVARVSCGMAAAARVSPAASPHASTAHSRRPLLSAHVCRGVSHRFASWWGIGSLWRASLQTRGRGWGQGCRRGTYIARRVGHWGHTSYLAFSAQRLEKRKLQSDREKAERAEGKKLLESIKSFERSLFKGSANADLVDLTRKVGLKSRRVDHTDEMNKEIASVMHSDSLQTHYWIFPLL